MHAHTPHTLTPTTLITITKKNRKTAPLLQSRNTADLCCALAIIKITLLRALVCCNRQLVQTAVKSNNNIRCNGISPSYMKFKYPSCFLPVPHPAP